MPPRPSTPDPFRTSPPHRPRRTSYTRTPRPSDSTDDATPRAAPPPAPPAPPLTQILAALRDLQSGQGATRLQLAAVASDAEALAVAFNRDLAGVGELVRAGEGHRAAEGVLREACAEMERVVGRLQAVEGEGMRWVEESEARLETAVGGAVELEPGRPAVLVLGSDGKWGLERRETQGEAAEEERMRLVAAVQNEVWEGVAVPIQVRNWLAVWGMLCLGAGAVVTLRGAWLIKGAMGRGLKWVGSAIRGAFFGSE